jgi:hypothetical protein
LLFYHAIKLFFIGKLFIHNKMDEYVCKLAVILHESFMLYVMKKHQEYP